MTAFSVAPDAVDAFGASGVRAQDRRDADLDGHGGLLLGLNASGGQWCNAGTMLTSSSVTTPSTMRNERISSVSGSRVDTRT